MKKKVEGLRIAWLDSTRMPSRIHRTVDGGTSTVCGHVPGDHDRILNVDAPRHYQGRSRYCRHCFYDGGKSIPWITLEKS